MHLVYAEAYFPYSLCFSRRAARSQRAYDWSSWLLEESHRRSEPQGLKAEGFYYSQAPYIPSQSLHFIPAAFLSFNAARKL